ncbi:BLUF domain-containing protein [Mesorhizobium sp. A623]
MLLRERRPTYCDQAARCLCFCRELYARHAKWKAIRLSPPPLNVGDSNNGGSRVEANLIRLTYVSTFYPFVTDDTISDLVVKAAEFNREHHITGVLAVEDARVCQILEGPTEAVDAFIALIQRDDRHHTVVQIEQSYQ